MFEAVQMLEQIEDIERVFLVWADKVDFVTDAWLVYMSIGDKFMHQLYAGIDLFESLFGRGFLFSSYESSWGFYRPSNLMQEV